jgi:predicted adenine nucleotide alpha hydrolase (AANH) superfamily ATPase
MSHVYELLQEQYGITAFFFNPNIQPEDERLKRLHELERFSSMKGFDLVTENSGGDEWNALIHPLRYHGERSERCWQCYRFRLEALFRKAHELGSGAVATTLSISPHKDAAMINRIGTDLQKKYGVFFLAADFKKNGGYRRSVELSKEYGFYRQDYCGCAYSRMERGREPVFMEESRLFRESVRDVDGISPEALSR